MSKTLYFEGAGWDDCKADYNGINCRIRTAFHNNEGKMVYLELMGCHQIGTRKNNPTFPATYLSVSFAFYITDDPTVDDCNRNKIRTISLEQMVKTAYTFDNIKNFVNEYCNADFDEAVVLDDLAGYRVFKRVGKGVSDDYNFGDCFNYDEELTRKRIAKVKELSEHFKEVFDLEYDNTDYYIRDGKLTVNIGVSESERLAAGYPDREFTVEV